MHYNHKYYTRITIIWNVFETMYHLKRNWKIKLHFVSKLRCISSCAARNVLCYQQRGGTSSSMIFKFTLSNETGFFCPIDAVVLALTGIDSELLTLFKKIAFEVKLTLDQLGLIRWHQFRHDYEQMTGGEWSSRRWRRSIDLLFEGQLEDFPLHSDSDIIRLDIDIK